MHPASVRRAHWRRLVPIVVIALDRRLRRRSCQLTAHAADTLLSQGKPATASSQEGADVDRGQRGRRQPRHALVQRVQRPAVAPGRPRRHRHDLPGRAAVGGRVRPGVPDPDLARRRRPGRPSTPRRPAPAAPQTLTVAGHRPLRADVRHRPRQRLRLLAVGVQGLRHGTAVRRHRPDAGVTRALDHGLERRPSTGPANTSPSSGELAAAHRHAVPGRRGRTGAPARSRRRARSTANVSLDGAGRLQHPGGPRRRRRLDVRPDRDPAHRLRPAARPARSGSPRCSSSPTSPTALGYWPGFRATGAAYRGNFTNWPGVGETDIMTDVNGRSQLVPDAPLRNRAGRGVRRVQRAHQRPRQLHRLPDRLPRVHARSSTARRPTRRSGSTSTAGRPGSCGRARSASPPGRPPCTTASTCGSTSRSAARCRTRSPASPRPTAGRPPPAAC